MVLLGVAPSTLDCVPPVPLGTSCTSAPLGFGGV